MCCYLRGNNELSNFYLFSRVCFCSVEVSLIHKVSAIASLTYRFPYSITQRYEKSYLLPNLSLNSSFVFSLKKLKMDEWSLYHSYFSANFGSSTDKLKLVPVVHHNSYNPALLNLKSFSRKVTPALVEPPK